MKTNYWWLLAAAVAPGLMAQTAVTPPPTIPVPEPAPAIVASPTVAETNAPPSRPAARRSAAGRRRGAARVRAAAPRPSATNAVAAAPKLVNLAPGPAVVAGNYVNVRGQANLRGEVITRLDQGTPVTVLATIPVEKPAKDEPAQWARIAYPTNAHVWVFSNYVDPTNNTVAVSRLNLRAGPGENYSVVGTLQRGDAVKEIITKDRWIEIEPPTNAFAFVAAELLKQEAPAAPEVPPQTNVLVAVQPVTPAETTNVTTVETNVIAEAATNAVMGGAVTSEAAGVAPTNEVAAATGSTNVALAALTATNETPVPEPTPVVVPAPVQKRVVEREGIVRASWSIQAPTVVELANPDTGETMDYLYSPSPQLNLRRYRGLRVLVKGEEGLDRRWPNTPVLTIQKIQVVE